MLVYYVPASTTAVATCAPCGDTLGLTIGSAVGGAAVLISVALLLYAIYRFYVSDQRKKQLAKVWKKFNLGVKLKVPKHLGSNCLSFIATPCLASS